MEKETPTRASSTITLNGKMYDAVSGQTVNNAGQPQPKTRQYGGFDIRPAHAVHGGPARSETLRRSGLSKPVPTRPSVSRHTRTISPQPTHPSVSRFGRPSDVHAVKPSDVLSSLNKDDLAQPIGLATQVQNYSPSASVRVPAHKAPVSKKEAVVAHQLKHVTKKPAPKKGSSPKTESRWRTFQKRMTLNPPIVITGIVILVIILSVICYLTVPALSLFVAAKSAGVDATYPGYVPNAYHFDGPVTYRDGDVTMKFKANGSSASFTIDQRSSYWDSGAVLDNYVLARSANYLTYSQSGITIYTFGSQAAWVNAGVLHTIDGSAPLTSDQILHIAGSM